MSNEFCSLTVFMSLNSELNMVLSVTNSGLRCSISVTNFSAEKEELKNLVACFVLS